MQILMCSSMSLWLLKWNCLCCSNHGRSRAAPWRFQLAVLRLPRCEGSKQQQQLRARLYAASDSLRCAWCHPACIRAVFTLVSTATRPDSYRQKNKGNRENRSLCTAQINFFFSGKDAEMWPVSSWAWPEPRRWAEVLQTSRTQSSLCLITCYSAFAYAVFLLSGKWSKCDFHRLPCADLCGDSEQLHSCSFSLFSFPSRSASWHAEPGKVKLITLCMIFELLESLL